MSLNYNPIISGNRGAVKRLFGRDLEFGVVFRGTEMAPNQAEGRFTRAGECFTMLRGPLADRE